MRSERISGSEVKSCHNIGFSLAAKMQSSSSEVKNLRKRWTLFATSAWCFPAAAESSITMATEWCCSAEVWDHEAIARSTTARTIPYLNHMSNSPMDLWT